MQKSFQNMNEEIKTIKKMIVIINGKGGTGKDILIESIKGQHLYVNISSIDPIKQIARIGGWKEEKTKKARLFLSNLKEVFYNYNKLSLIYLQKKTKEFFKDNFYEILFVHIRQPKQIEEYKNLIKSHYKNIDIYTILIQRSDIDIQIFNNLSDDNVDNYNYDFIFKNNKTIEKGKQEFLLFIDSLLSNNTTMIEHLHDLDTIV